MSRLLYTLSAAAFLVTTLPAGAADVPNRPANQANQPAQMRPMIAIAPALKSLTLDSGQFVKAPSNFTLTDDGSNKSCIVSLDWGDGSITPQYAIAGFRPSSAIPIWWPAPIRRKSPASKPAPAKSRPRST
ncbi:MAG: hypothetical protein JWN73_2070 [Betaproteobacteria bacterium]|nr:hypothetical protein [Betaproteobacteria bacterium]